MLNAYLTQVQALIQAPSSPIPLVSNATLTSYINIARGQVAADAECIRVPATLTLVIAQQSYSFSSIALTLGGLSSALTVRMAFLPQTPSGYTLIDIRPWEWFATYCLTAGGTGPPERAAQQGQGSAGTLYFWPIPVAPATVLLDAVCLPSALAADGDPEAIPYPWTDAVPFYAAWLAMQSVQRQADAEMMLRRYKELALRGRQEATPSVLPGQLPGDAAAKMAASKSTLTGEGAQQAAR